MLRAMDLFDSLDIFAELLTFIIPSMAFLDVFAGSLFTTGGFLYLTGKYVSFPNHNTMGALNIFMPPIRHFGMGMMTVGTTLIFRKQLHGVFTRFISSWIKVATLAFFHRVLCRKWDMYKVVKLQMDDSTYFDEMDFPTHVHVVCMNRQT